MRHSYPLYLHRLYPNSFPILGISFKDDSAMVKAATVAVGDHRVDLLYPGDTKSFFLEREYLSERLVEERILLLQSSDEWEPWKEFGLGFRNVRSLGEAVVNTKPDQARTLEGGPVADLNAYVAEREGKVSPALFEYAGADLWRITRWQNNWQGFFYERKTKRFFQLTENPGDPGREYYLLLSDKKSDEEVAIEERWSHRVNFVASIESGVATKSELIAGAEFSLSCVQAALPALEKKQEISRSALVGLELWSDSDSGLSFEREVRDPAQEKTRSLRSLGVLGHDQWSPWQDYGNVLEGIGEKPRSEQEMLCLRVEESNWGRNLALYFEPARKMYWERRSNGAFTSHNFSEIPDLKSADEWSPARESYQMNPFRWIVRTEEALYSYPEIRHFAAGGTFPEAFVRWRLPKTELVVETKSGERLWIDSEQGFIFAQEKFSWHQPSTAGAGMRALDAGSVAKWKTVLQHEGNAEAAAKIDAAEKKRNAGLSEEEEESPKMTKRRKFFGLFVGLLLILSMVQKALAADEAKVETYGDLMLLETNLPTPAKWLAQATYLREFSNPFLSIQGARIGVRRHLNSLAYVGIDFSRLMTSETTINREAQNRFNVQGLEADTAKPQSSLLAMVEFVPLSGRINLFAWKNVGLEVLAGGGYGIFSYQNRDSRRGIRWSTGPRLTWDDWLAFTVAYGQEIERPLQDGSLSRTQLDMGLGVRF